MGMIQHDFEQGSDAWHAHRPTCNNASELPVVRGISPYKSRTKYLHELVTGISEEVDEATQRRFDDGHTFEALARPLAAKIIGQKLFPVVGSLDFGLLKPLGASFDGLTMDESINFEHKTLNAELRATLSSGSQLSELYTSQMDQQMLVSGAEKTLFMASTWEETDEITEHFIEFDSGRKYYRLIEEFHCWYEPSEGSGEKILMDWQQLEKDREEYARKFAAGEIEPPKEMPKAEAMAALPTLFIQAKGEITPESSQNLVKFSEKTAQYLADRKADLQHLRTSPDVTDQDVANAKARGADCREAVKRLTLVQDGVLAQTMTLGEAMASIDKLKEDYRLVALDLEKEADKAIDAKKLAILSKAKFSYADHTTALEIETKPISLSVTPPDFALAMKGKKSIKGWQDAVDAALANGKIAADAEAKDICAKLAWCKETSAGYGFLFNDLAQIIRKPMDDFRLTVTTRINQHKIDEAARLEAERERMRLEEEAKARAKVEAEAAAIAEAKRKEETKAGSVETERTNNHMPVSASVVGMVREGQSGQKPDVQHPTRQSLIKVIAFEYGVKIETAEGWLRAEFGQMAA